MKILDRYLTSHFLQPLAVCTSIFFILVFVGHFFDKASVFNSFKPSAGYVLLYLLLGLPYWINISLPVAVLLALMFALGALQQRGELTAMRSAGISSWRLYTPFLGVGLLVSLISLWGGTFLIPAFTAKATKIYHLNIRKEQPHNGLRDHVVVAGRNNQLFTIGMVDGPAGTVSDIVIDRLDSSEHRISTLSASHGHYLTGGTWTFTDGMFVQFNPAGKFNEEHFTTKTMDISEKPEDFIYEALSPEDMTYRELTRRIHHLNELGVPAFKEKVALQLQIALPFANVLVILLGIPFAMASAKKGRTHSIALAFGVTFAYWGTVSVFQSFGEHGSIPAWFSAWAANVFFGAYALWRLRNMGILS